MAKTPEEARHHLRNLSEIDVSNLRAGRITRQAMRRALNRAHGRQGIDPHPQTGLDCIVLADTLNDMLEAARVFDDDAEPLPQRMNQQER